MHCVSSVDDEFCQGSSVDQRRVFQNGYMRPSQNTRSLSGRKDSARLVSALHRRGKRSHIQNQKEHHRRKTFQEEFRALLDKHGIAYEACYLFVKVQPSASRTPTHSAICDPSTESAGLLSF